jgi:hypothetical protein
MGWVEDDRGFVVVSLPSGERVVARKAANYAEGWRWCPQCMLAYDSLRCPIHGWPLRNASRMRRRRKAIRRIEVDEE